MNTTRRKAATPSRKGAKKKSTRRRSPRTPREQSENEVLAKNDVRLTNPAKLLYPENGISKRDLANYYSEVADWILPHLQGRPIVVVRCPEGNTGDCFYQKHPGAGTPEQLRQIEIEESKSTGSYAVVDDRAGLTSLAQIGALEIHAWGSREERLDRPDRMIFDLDPDAAVPWKRVVEAAREMRGVLQQLGLESFLKTTGGKGLHLVVPIERRHDWEEVKSLSKQVAQTVADAAPDDYTANLSKAARKGKIFIDYLRNGRGATAVVPYSTRAKAGAPISTPLHWDELTARLKSDHFHLGNIRRRLSSLSSDPWEGFSTLRQRLTEARKVLNANR